MDIVFCCPACGKRLTLGEMCIGHQVQCPFCNAVFLLTESLMGHTAPQMVHTTGVSTLQTQRQQVHHQQAMNAVVLDARPIGFWARVVAATIDSIVTVVASVIVAVAAGFFTAAIGAFVGNAELFGQLVVIVTSWLYCALMEASDVQATLGKLVIGAKVVDTNGGKLTFGRATGRHFSKYISSILLCVGYVVAAFDERKRGLHDMIAGTCVVSRR